MVARGGHSVSAVPHYPYSEIDRSLLWPPTFHFSQLSHGSIDTTGPDRCPPPPCQSPFTPSTATERKHRMKKGDAPQSEEEWWNKMIHWPEGEVCVSVCVRTHPCFSTSVWTTARRTMGQGHGKTLLWITLKQAKELGLIYERISTIYLKICNVCAAWQGKKGAATVKECLCSTLL